MMELLKRFWIPRFRRREERTALRLCGILLCAAVLVAASIAPALAVEGSRDVVAPRGSYWDEELGVLVFDPPIPLMLPNTLTFNDNVDMLLYDGGLLYYAVVQDKNYYALTKMTRPNCDGDNWILTSVLLGEFNNPDYPMGDPGEVRVYDHVFDDYCIPKTPNGDMLGSFLGSQMFQGLPYPPDTTPYAVWTQVDFDTPIPIVDPDFWVVWDYLTPDNVPPPYASWYGVGNFRIDPPLEPEDYYRFYEGDDTPCPGQFVVGFGPWLIRAVGHCFQAEGPIDIKPQSCPNPLNVKSKGVLPVGILGTADLDVRDIDPTTIKLEGVPVLRWAYEDVATPFPGELCDCWTEGPDGWEDLAIKFVKQEVVKALGDVNDRDTLELTVTWELYDGSGMQGSDCVIILKKPAHKPRYSDIQTAGVRSATVSDFALFQNTPNPVKSRTTIMFSLPASAHTTLTIHDASGALVGELVNGERATGLYTVEWNADVPAGVYFYRLQSGDMSATKKLIRLQ